MDVIEAIYTTRAMRRLSPDPIPDEVLPKLFDAAIRGPNSGNAQLFRFITVTDPEMKQTVQGIYRECLDELNATRYAGAQEKVTSGDPDDPDVQQTIKIDKSAQWLADNLHVAPMLIFVFGKEGGETTTFPCLWNLCLAARSFGLGTAITTLLKVQRQRVEDLMGMPRDSVWTMHGMVPIGFPTGRWGVPRRQPAEEAVFSETWGQAVDWSVPEPLWTPDY
ncbi:MAG: nitroreductase family protein [Acidimicrobiales bacterium]|nr:nitroreductase family protein [Acidimicrobiales bacterium]